MAGKLDVVTKFKMVAALKGVSHQELADLVDTTDTESTRKALSIDLWPLIVESVPDANLEGSDVSDPCASELYFFHKQPSKIHIKIALAAHLQAGRELPADLAAAAFEVLKEEIENYLVQKPKFTELRGMDMEITDIIMAKLQDEFTKADIYRYVSKLLGKGDWEKLRDSHRQHTHRQRTYRNR